MMGHANLSRSCSVERVAGAANLMLQIAFHVAILEADRVLLHAKVRTGAKEMFAFAPIAMELASCGHLRYL
jgi:hypothetical protein